MSAESAGKRVLCCLLVFIFAVPSGVPGQGSSPSVRFTQEELDQMLAPVALYPDSLLAQILMASTYPVEVVEADHWVKSNKNLKGDQLNAALDQRSWDLSVKALVSFPQVLAQMSEKLNWTQRLGDALLLQEAEVMDTIQHLRSKAYAQGTLKNTQEHKVLVEQQIIRVEPVNPQVVHVPTYNPTVVYGSWWYPSYPPYSYYPAGAVTATGLISFAAGVAVGSAWNSGWGFWNWGGHQINANVNRNININQNNVNIDNIQTSKWQHSAEHRKGDPYRSQEVRDRYGQGPKGDPARRKDFRGFDQRRKDDLTAKVGDRGKNLGGDSVDTKQPIRDLSQQKDRSERQDLQEQQGRGSCSAFQDIGRGDDAQKFSDRGQASRQSAGNLKAGGGQLREAGGGGRGRQ